MKTENSNVTIKISKEICSVIYITGHKELHDKMLFLDESGVSRFILGTKDKDITVRNNVIIIKWLDIKRGINLLSVGNGNYLVLFVYDGDLGYLIPADTSNLEKVQLTYN